MEYWLHLSYLAEVSLSSHCSVTIGKIKCVFWSSKQRPIWVWIDTSSLLWLFKSEGCVLQSAVQFCVWNSRESAYSTRGNKLCTRLFNLKIQIANSLCRTAFAEHELHINWSHHSCCNSKSWKWNFFQLIPDYFSEKQKVLSYCVYRTL